MQEQPLETLVQNIELLLLIAAIVAMVGKRLRMPYIVGLVLAGIGLAFLPLNIQIPLTKDLVFYILLPPLIFEAAFYIPWKELRRDLLLIVTFATLGVALSAGVTAAGSELKATSSVRSAQRGSPVIFVSSSKLCMSSTIPQVSNPWRGSV